MPAVIFLLWLIPQLHMNHLCLLHQPCLKLQLSVIISHCGNGNYKNRQCLWRALHKSIEQHALVRHEESRRVWTVMVSHALRSVMCSLQSSPLLFSPVLPLEGWKLQYTFSIFPYRHKYYCGWKISEWKQNYSCKKKKVLHPVEYKLWKIFLELSDSVAYVSVRLEKNRYWF